MGVVGHLGAGMTTQRSLGIKKLTNLASMAYFGTADQKEALVHIFLPSKPVDHIRVVIGIRESRIA